MRKKKPDDVQLMLEKIDELEKRVSAFEQLPMFTKHGTPWSETEEMMFKEEIAESFKLFAKKHKRSVKAMKCKFLHDLEDLDVCKVNWKKLHE